MTAVTAFAAAAAGGTDADLLKAAAQGDEEAFADLYRRHAQTGWRLAHAVALAAADAEDCLAEGFVRALRGVRRHRVPASQPFRPVLLAGVYLAASDRLALPGQPVASTAAAAGADPLTSAAFRSLPDRWRAALWLAEVEGMTPPRIAPVMGVSAAVGAQLVIRGRRGLADRFRQAGEAAPDPMAPALRALAPPLPPALAARALGGWQAALAGDGGYRLGPALAWLNERAARPLAVAVGGILALGLVGLGVVGQRSNIDTFGPAALGSGPAAAGGVGVGGASQTLRPIGAGGNSLLIGEGGPALAPAYATVGATSSFASVAALPTAGGGAGSAPAASPTPAPRSAPAPAAGTAGGTPHAPVTAPSGGSGGSGGTSSPGTTTPARPATTLPPITVTTTPLLAPVTTLVTTGGGGVQVNLGPIGGVSVGGTTTTTPPTTAPATTTTTRCAVTLPSNPLLNVKLICPA